MYEFFNFSLSFLSTFYSIQMESCCVCLGNKIYINKITFSNFKVQSRSFYSRFIWFREQRCSPGYDDRERCIFLVLPLWWCVCANVWDTVAMAAILDISVVMLEFTYKSFTTIYHCRTIIECLVMIEW
jgi:hypothetical protein